MTENPILGNADDTILLTSNRLPRESSKNEVDLKTTSSIYLPYIDIQIRSLLNYNSHIWDRLHAASRKCVDQMQARAIVMINNNPSKSEDQLDSTSILMKNSSFGILEIVPHVATISYSSHSFRKEQLCLF